MSSEEAAASLFGSDDASSDPFATLGSSTEATDADDLFAAQPDAGFAVDEGDPFGFSGQNMPQESTHHSQNDYGYSHEPQTTGTAAYDPYKPTQSQYGGQDSWNAQRTTEAVYGGNTSQSVPTAASNYAASYSNVYTPQTYAPPAPAPVSQPNPPTSAGAYGNQYTPQTYAPPATTYTPHSVYSPPPTASPYAPIAAAHAAPPQPSYFPPYQTSHKPPTTIGHTPYGGTVAAPPPPPVATVPITRPKVANAYDPPFLASKTRRVSKAAPAQQAYNVYQSPPPPVNYPPPSPAVPSNQVNPYQENAYPSQDYRQTSPEVVLRHPPAPPPPARTASPYSNGYVPPPPVQAPPSRAYSPAVDVKPPPPKREVSETSPPSSAHLANGGSDKYAPHRHASPVGSFGRPASRSHNRNTSVGSNTSLPRSNTSQGATSPPQVLSPSMIPLPFSPPPGTQSPEGPHSPELSTKSPTQYSPYAPPPQATQHHAQPPMPPLPGPKKFVHDPYTPSAIQHVNHYIPRTASPLHNEYNPQTRKSSVSTNLNGSATSPYHPVSRSGLPPSGIPKPLSLEDPMHHSLAPIRPTVSQYAPSPSLLGANDPLARTSARAPVITFGFGGKMVTCFHGMPGLNTGFDVALSARTTSELKVRVLQKIHPESALNTPGAVYPGPLVSDPDTSALSLIKSGAVTQSKNKKTALLAYLTARADEINQGLGYLAPDQRKRSESKMILLKLLKVLVEHDGRLLGVSQAESAVRQALVPHLNGETTLQDGISLQAAYQTGSSDEAPLSVTSLRPSMLSKIEDFLLQGDRRQAYHYAMDQKLWAHAMVISSSLDKEAWKSVVNEFLRSELASKDSQPRGLPAVNDVKSYESLRMAYSLYSGQGSASVQELAPPASLQQMAGTGLLQPPATPSLSTMTPRTPNFPAVQPPLNIPVVSLAKWAETVAMIISSPLSAETSAALTALGDQLAARDWIDAAHACFLLSPQTSSVAGHGTPGARITLVGTKNPANAFKDPDSVILSEILEFTMSLVPTTKGQEPFHGLPHLQAYRFMRAVWLAEIGDMQMANRYCDAIAASLGQNSPYTTPTLVEQLSGLKQRLTGVSHGDKSGSWIGNKLTKPSLDSIGGWLEGRFTKLVTGDIDSPNPADVPPVASDSQFGPFAHYSTISSTTPSERSSPQPEAYVPAFAAAGHPRSSSEIGGSSPYAPPPPERSSSAMGYSRAKPPMPSNPSSTYSIPSSQSSPSGYGFNGPPLNVSETYTPKTHTSNSEELETPVQSNNGSWWGSDESNQNTQTPTASTFMNTTEGSVDSGSEGFISLMDNQSFAFESGPPSRESSTPALLEVDDEEDLGFGNSKPKSKPEQKEGSNGSPTTASPAAAALKAVPPAAEMPAEKPAGGSWFGRLWGRSESTGPVKASLGEQSAFYYDKDLKRWVNKKAGPEESKPAPTPPPPRSQTASPGMAMSGRGMPPPVGTGPPSRSASTGPGGPPPPPPQRPMSAIDLTTEPPTKVPPRIRSNLAPPGADSLPGTPTTPGPPSRPRSQASRKSVRSRYVDVFSQETGGSASS